jgi:hypothetical protein
MCHQSLDPFLRDPEVGLVKGSSNREAERYCEQWSDKYPMRSDFGKMRSRRKHPWHSYHMQLLLLLRLERSEGLRQVGPVHFSLFQSRFNPNDLKAQCTDL